MKKKKIRRLCMASCLLAAFVLWTAAVSVIDVQPIGPRGSSVGFSSLNGWFHALTGVHMSLYVITDWLSLVPLGIAAGFGCMGLMQWIRRRHIMKVDADILALGGFYVIVAAAYVCFELLPVNARPVLIEGMLETSYPSSTTMLVLCMMPTAMMQLHRRMKSSAFSRGVLLAMAVFAAAMVIARCISGVHWLTDIIGGVLLSAGLTVLYAAAL